MANRVGMEALLVKALSEKKTSPNDKVSKKVKDKEVSEITKQLKELHQMSRFLQDKLSTLESSSSEIKCRISFLATSVSIPECQVLIHKLTGL